MMSRGVVQAHDERSPIERQSKVLERKKAFLSLAVEKIAHLKIWTFCQLLIELVDSLVNSDNKEV